MTTGFGFSVREVTGRQRFINLRDRTLPYQPIAYPGRQRFKKTWYAGNPEATIQVLGPMEEPSEFRGKWKDKYVAGQAEVLNGFPQPDTAEDLVRIFEDIRISGQPLEVQWGGVIRFGILEFFEPRYDRIEDIAWTMRFEWFRNEDRTAFRAFADEDPIPDLKDGLNAVDDQLAVEPTNLLDDFSESIRLGVADIRLQTGVMFDLSARIDAGVTLSIEARLAFNTAVEEMRSGIEDQFTNLSDVPYTVAQTDDTVQAMLRTETWRRTQARTMADHRATAQRRDRDLELQAKPSAIQIVKVPGNTSIRQIALTAYGDADSWTLIADANCLRTSVVEAGTTIVIPPPPSSSGGDRGRLRP